MNFKNVLFLFFIFIFTLEKLFAQTINPAKTDYKKVQSLRKASINLLGIEVGLEVEKRISKKSTITFFGGVIFARLGSNFFDFKAPIITAGTAAVEYRNYYNFQNRVNKNKEISNNNANFFLARTSVVFPVSGLTYYNFFVSTGYGINRKIVNNLNVEAALGVTQRFGLDDKKNNIRYKPNYQVIPFFKLNISLIF